MAAFAGDGFDAAHAGRDAALVDDLEQADVAGAPDVRAAAELLAETGDVDDAHLVAVLFAEQRHGAGPDGLIERHDRGFDRGVAQDLLVDQALDFFDLGLVERGVMREVEAQPRRLDHAAGLLDVRAQHLAQRGVEQVRGGVVAHGGEARRVVDLRAHLVADADRRDGTMRCAESPGTAG